MRTQGAPGQSLLFSTILIYTLLAGTAAAQPAALVRDINQQLHHDRDSFPGSFVEAGGIVFFTASDAAHGRELWRTDGTPEGTFLVKDVRPGPDGSVPGELTAYGDVLLFAATDGNRGVEVWRSDGTAAGTVLVADVETGPGDSVPSGFTELAGNLYFVAFDATAGRELWKTDGTAAGTVRVGDPGPQSTFAEDVFAGDGGLTAAGGRLFFAAFDDEAGQELWTSDGTPAGTFRLADLDPGPGSSGPQLLTAVGDTLFFRAGREDGWTDRELWKSDGTAAGTMRVADVRPGPEGSEISGLVAFQGQAFFYADDGVHGMELWKSDGNVAGGTGTVLVADVVPGIDPSAIFEPLLTPVGDTLYFRADAGSGHELWASDGTAAGTALVRDVVQGPGGSNPGHLTAFGDLLLFAAFNGVDRSQLWRSDGTAAGTFLLLDVPQNVHSSPEELAAAGGFVFFNAFVSREVGVELWRSDGTAAGTELIEDLDPSPGLAFDRLEISLAAAGGTLFLFADDGLVGREPWTSDGTAAGTARLADLQPGELPSVGRFSETLALGGALFFTGGNRTLGTELWRSDGTPAGTLPVTSLAPAEGGFTIGELTALGSTILFAANHGGLGTELWRTRGEPGVAGSQELVQDIRPGPFSSFPEHLTVAGGQVFFTATEDVAFRALWRSDGTPAGTSRVSTLSPREMAAVGATLYFVAGDGLWKLEPGAGSVPVRVADLPGPVGARASQLTTSGGILYFVAAGDASGPELWRSDGTAAGTFQVADVRPGPEGSYPLSLTAPAGGLGGLFFTADDGASGRELWRVTGAASGAVRVADVYPGPESGQPQGLAVVAGKLLFAATDPVHGNELWGSDGTPAGTRLLQDAVPGIRSSSPSDFTLEGDRVFFLASHPETGRELWSLPLAALQEADPAGQLRDLIAAVRAFPLPAREGEDLVKRLEKALRFLEDGNPNNDRAAQSALDGFVRKVEAQRGRRIPAATAAAWIAAAQAILQVITEGA